MQQYVRYRDVARYLYSNAVVAVGGGGGGCGGNASTKGIDAGTKSEDEGWRGSKVPEGDGTA